MGRLILPFAAIGTLVLGGCTSWTEFGQGGMAEQDTPRKESVEPGMTSPTPFELRQDLNHNQRHLDVLVLEGAGECFPASVYDAKVRENRINREIAGGLYEDAENDLIIQRQDLNRIEQKLDAVIAEVSCWDANPAQLQGEDTSDSNGKASMDTRSLPVTQTEHLLLLLNSDNQFAHDSDQINPKYADNLTIACAILNNEPGLKLNITGHSDKSGETIYNSKLSAQRTMAVVSYLIDCNIDPARIDSSFKGDTTPLYSGRSPAIDLVNRRVSVELVAGRNGNL